MVLARQQRDGNSQLSWLSPFYFLFSLEARPMGWCGHIQGVSSLVSNTRNTKGTSLMPPKCFIFSLYLFICMCMPWREWKEPPMMAHSFNPSNWEVEVKGPLWVPGCLCVCCVYTWMCIWVCCVCIYVYMCVLCVYASMCMCVLCVYACMCICVLCVCMYMCMCACMCVCVCMCVYPWCFPNKATVPTSLTQPLICSSSLHSPSSFGKDWHRVSYSPGWPWTPSVADDGFELILLPLPTKFWDSSCTEYT